MMFRPVPDRSLWLAALHLEKRISAALLLLLRKFRRVRSIVVLASAKLGQVFIGCFSHFAGPADAISRFYGADDVSTEAELRNKRRWKGALIVRRFVPLSDLKPGPVEYGSRD